LLSTAMLLSACASTRNTRRTASADSAKSQFFLGKIQRSSVNGAQKYGPPFESLVRRTVDIQAGKIKECVFQENKAFITDMSKGENPLIFTVKDRGGFSEGDLIMEDETASAWSYDVKVLKPKSGKITGSLDTGYGARIFPDGSMEIRKIWSDQVLIFEIYHSISESEYLDRLKTMAPAEMADLVAKECR
jgi:hypothetical protein